MPLALSRLLHGNRSPTGSARNTAIAVAVAFLSAFVTCFILGAVNGSEHRDAIVRTGVLKRLRIVNSVHGVSIVHDCHGHPTYAYSLDLQQLRPLNESRAPDIDLLASLTPHKEFIVEMMGGASAGLTFAEFFGFARVALVETAAAGTARGKFWTALGGLVGGLSGYQLGYWFAVGHAAECDSSPVRERLEKPDYWPDVIRRYAMAVAYSVLTVVPEGIEQRRYRTKEEDFAATFSDTFPIVSPAINCNFGWLARPKFLEKLEYIGTRVSSADMRDLENLSLVMRRMDRLLVYQAMVEHDLKASRFSFSSPQLASEFMIPSRSDVNEKHPLLDDLCIDDSSPCQVQEKIVVDGKDKISVKGEDRTQAAVERPPEFSPCDKLKAAYERSLASVPASPPGN